jgi:hypothetical protein
MERTQTCYNNVMFYYPQGFFDLNFRYAQRISEVSGLSIGDAMLNYTHLYLAFGLGRSFDPTLPAWVEFLSRLALSSDPLDWINQTYARLSGGLPPPEPENSFGGFSYAVWEGGRVRLHFRVVSGSSSPLQRTQMPARLRELRPMFAHLRANVRDVRTVLGGSWLYNIEAYRRLFPAGYLATAAPEEPETQFIALWGQFLDHNRQVKPDLAARFLDAIARQSTLEGLLNAFPYPVLRLEGPVEEFYKFYGVE